MNEFFKKSSMRITADTAKKSKKMIQVKSFIWLNNHVIRI